MDSKKKPDSIYEVIKGLVREPVRAVMEQLYGEPVTREPAALEVLEYVQVLEYAAERRAEDRRVMATLLRRERKPNGWLVTQVFMDENDALMRKGKGLLGRSLQVKTFDAELADIFGEEESAVVELPEQHSVVVDSKKKPDGIYEVIKGLVRKPVRAVMEQLYGEPVTREPAALEVLEYVQVLEYAAERRAEDRRVMATLLRRERKPDGWLVTQVFMDENDALMRKGKGLLGRSLQVKTFDAELADIFGEEESVVVELPEQLKPGGQENAG